MLGEAIDADEHADRAHARTALPPVGATDHAQEHIACGIVADRKGQLKQIRQARAAIQDEKAAIGLCRCRG